ncbi:MAG: DUF1684 domain-containing protein [Nocardioides sp.]|nr:DUF1684 domain-containing protein [Nocardioides sp.]
MQPFVGLAVVTTGQTFEQAWQEWREQREARLRDPAGFLAITGLHWLGDRPQRFDDVPGAWRAAGRSATVELAADETLQVGGHVVSGTHTFAPVDGAGTLARWGDAVVEIAERFGSVVLRPRHPDAPNLDGYVGTPAYDPDASWQVTARFEAYAEPQEVEVGTAVEGRSREMAALGEVVFEVEGRPQRLIAFDDDGDGLWLLFTDETSGVTTYAACRQLATAPPVDGKVLLDFNRTLNMACAYTSFATCPLPPMTNHVDVLVEAGEKIPLVACRS